MTKVASSRTPIERDRDPSRARVVELCMLRALLWDHDGVMVDTEGLYYQATREALASRGVELTPDGYRALFLVEGQGAFHLVREQGASDAEIEALRQWRNQRYMELLTEGDVVLPGVEPLLARLARRYRMAIVTSSQRQHFERIHLQSGIPRHFELVLTREAYTHSKPNPEPYLTALSRLGLSADECLVIEDSERGLRAAKAAGLCCWVVPSGLTSGSRFEQADRVFPDLGRLAATL
ncbi:MAG TPA: HAD family phosphatase [Polyangiales bacterium]